MKLIRRFNSVSDMNTAVQTAPHRIVAVTYENGRIYPKIKRSNRPKNLVISCTENIVRISAIRATSILYRTDPNDAWTTYTEPFAISETVTVYAKAVNAYGEITTSKECAYVPLPSNLTISCSANTVTISATDATTIQYRTNPNDSWTTYTEPFAISETVTVYAKASNAYGEITGSQECVYVAPPSNLVISCINNTVTITADNATTIEYRTNPSGEWTTYSAPFAITETVTVYAKASNSVGEITGSQLFTLPSNLTISCTANTVTISATDATTIQYRTNPSGEWTTYTQPFAITETVTVYAKASNAYGEITGSQECVYVAPPSNLVISCTSNMVTITADNATTIQYRTNPSGEWVTYSAPFAITETVTVYAKASNAGGEITGSQECVYVAPPSNLVISCTSNMVAITADNATAIQYRTNPSGSWVTYTEPFAITETVTVYAKASNAGGEISGSQECVYVPLPSNLVISCSANTVTISATDATTIQYRTDPNDSWTTYAQPFAISETVTVYAKASNAYGEITGSQLFTLPSNLTISCSANTVSIRATDTTTIQYRIDPNDSWTTYTQPFAITETVTVYAKASNAYGEITGSQECIYSMYEIPFYIENTSSESALVSIKKSNSSASTITIQKSTDGTNWFSFGTTSTTARTATVPVGGKLYLRSSATTWSTTSNYYNNITCNKAHKVGGNINSLLYGSSFNGQTEFPSGVRTYTFNYLFYGNTYLTNASELQLPATTLAQYCYSYMFNGCTALTTAPATLPATTLATYCYYYMFNGCTGLTTAPVLSATTLANNCYQSMFYGCTALTTAPELPATTMVADCYNTMFAHCTSLTTAPALSATTLADNCYNTMFYGCTSLTTAPATLPATTLAQYCYYQMFFGCTALTTAPELPATTLAQYCYCQMFMRCNSLNYIKCLATDISANGCTTNWVSVVAATGTFVKDPNMSNWTIGVNGIPSGWIYSVPTNLKILCTNNVVKITATDATTIQYRTDPNDAWTTYTQPFAISETVTVYAKASNGVGDTTGSQECVYIATPINLTIACANNTVTITVDNATTIQYKTDPNDSWTTYTQPFGITETVTVYAKASNTHGDTTASQECIYYNYTIPFYIENTSGESATVSIKKSNANAPTITIQKSTDGINWSGLGTTSTTARTATVPVGGKLYLKSSATTWATSTSYNNIITCNKAHKVGGNINSLLYGRSFNGQTEFPSGVRTYTFSYLFYYNTYLTDASELQLPATTLVNYCYSDMFCNCTALTSTPLILPAITLADSCYSGMFVGCTSLISTHLILPATTLAKGCYFSMFESCTSLTTAPALPATTLAGGCYRTMFYGCTSLNYIKCLATDISATNCTSNWTASVAASGTFVKDPSMSDWTTGASGIPSGWTVEDNTN